MRSIALDTLKTQGKINTKFHDGILETTASVKVNKYNHRSTPSLIVPDKHKLPFRIDLTINIDAVGLYIIVGNGIIPFKAGWQGRAIIDIVDGESKPFTNMKMFDASFALNEDTDISIIYDYEFMMIQINGEMRYLSKTEKYMKSKSLTKANEEGFEVKIAIPKHTNMKIAFLAVTEYSKSDITIFQKYIKEKEEVFLEIPAGITKGKETLEECIALLPESVQQEIMKTNDHLMGMKKTFKLKRSIEGTHKGGRIKYVSSEWGFAYTIVISNDWASHNFWWSMYSNYKYGDFMARKNDFTEATLRKLAESSPDFAFKIFDYYGECGICDYANSNGGCKGRTIYEYNGIKKASCHGKMVMNMKVETFQDLRRMFNALYEVIAKIIEPTR